MKAINHHLGLPVIALDSGERIGDVLRFIIDQVAGRVVAVAVTRKWYAEPAGVLFEHCSAFGQNVVLVASGDSLKPLSQIPEAGLHLEASNDARQRTAITESGRLLGAVTDEAFDESTGEVTGYRLDVFAETGRGRSVYVPHRAFVTSSATVAILRDDVLQAATPTLEELNDRGDTAAVPRRTVVAPARDEDFAAENTESIAEAVVDMIDQVPASALVLEESQPAAPEPETTTPEAREAQDRVMRALSVGKVAGATVTAPDGRLIIEAGQIITDEVADAARDAGRLYEVWISVQG